MINYVKGDATSPIGDGVKLIVHVCNDIGAWGAGFVLALSKKWITPEKQYKRIPPTNVNSAMYSMYPLPIILLLLI